MKDMVIISMEEYNEAQAMFKKNDPNPNKARPTRRGSLLLTGLLYCDCNKKFTSVHFKRTEKRQDGTTWEYDRHAYRCTSFTYPKDGQPKCYGKVYTAGMFDNMVIRDAKKFIREIDREKLTQSVKDVLKEQRDDIAEQLRLAGIQLAQKEKELQHLKNEVIKVIMGESSFSKEMLNDMVQSKETEVNGFKIKKESMRMALDEIDIELAKRRSIEEDLETWEARFDRQGTMDKKDMLINIIDKITVHKEELEVEYKIKVGESEIDPENFDSDQENNYNNNIIMFTGAGGRAHEKSAFLSAGFVNRGQPSTGSICMSK